MFIDGRIGVNKNDQGQGIRGKFVRPSVVFYDHSRAKVVVGKFSPLEIVAMGVFSWYILPLINWT